MPNVDQMLRNVLTQETSLDRYAEPVQSFFSRIFQGLGRTVNNLLNGSWLGHPLHPVLTDIPVGAWTAAVTLDAMEASSGRRGIGRAADAAVLLGIAGATGSAITGLADWQYTVGESRRTGFTHATLNTLALGLFISSLIARGSGNRGLGRTLSLAGYSVVAASAYLGGDLVFRQRIGVDHSPEEETIETDNFVPVIALDQLPENHLTIGLLNNIPLVMLRRGDQVYALAETCAHLGGPLADGKLETSPEGHPVVVCPWHGSHFDMETGDVLQGPSAYPQPCFKTRIRDGQVEVRFQPLVQPTETADE